MVAFHSHSAQVQTETQMEINII